MKTLYLLLFVITFFSQAQTQPSTQIVRGRITDAQSEFPLTGVNVFVLGTDPLVGTATDMEKACLLRCTLSGSIALAIS